MNWGQNTYLKDANTVTILPAPPETRAEGIEWYEVQISVEDRSFDLLAFDADGIEVERASYVWLVDDEGTFVFTWVFTKGGQEAIAGKTSATRSERDGLKITIESNNEEIGMFSASDPTQLANMRLLENAPAPHWTRLANPLHSFAIALKSRAITASSWSCASCIGLGVAANLCFWTNPALFTRCLPVWDLFVDECTGACPPEDESG